MPRGSVSTKKRSFGEGDGGSPVQQVKKPKTKGEIFHPYQQIQLPPAAQMQGQGLLKPQPIPKTQSSRPKPSPSSSQQQVQRQLQPQPKPEPEQQPQIDPNLFSMYTEHDENAGYNDTRASYPTEEQPLSYGMRPGLYQLPSLEQIANEVLVDLNGDDNQEQDLKSQLMEFNSRMPNGVAKEDSFHSPMEMRSRTRVLIVLSRFRHLKYRTRRKLNQTTLRNRNPSNRHCQMVNLRRMR